MRIRDNNSVCF